MSDSTALVVDARLQSLDSPQSGSATQPVALEGCPWAPASMPSTCGR
jgi:hypothetical protein